MDWWSGWTEAATNSCKISCSNAERRGTTPLYWINSYNKRPGGVSSLCQLVGCLSTSIVKGAREVPPEAAGVNRYSMLSHIAQGETKLPGTRERERECTQC